MEVFLLLIVGILVGCIAQGVSTYNKLNPLREELREGEGNIEVCMHKMIDLTQKLAALATRYGLHEQTIFLQISRDQRKAHDSIYQRSLQAITQITGYADTFPTLKADQTYLRIMSDLDRLASEAQQRYEDYNRRAKTYNTERTSFPTVMISTVLGFAKASYLNQTRWYPAHISKKLH